MDKDKIENTNKKSNVDEDDYISDKVAKLKQTMRVRDSTLATSSRSLSANSKASYSKTNLKASYSKTKSETSKPTSGETGGMPNNERQSTTKQNDETVCTVDQVKGLYNDMTKMLLRLS